MSQTEQDARPAELPEPKKGQCSTCRRANFRLRIAGTTGYCTKCLTHQHQREMHQMKQHEMERGHQYKLDVARQQQQRTRDEAERQHQHEREESEKQRQHEAKESERQHQHAMEDSARQLEIELAKKDQEESKLQQEDLKLNQEKIIAKTNEVQKAQEVEIQNIKLQQIMKETKIREKEIEMERMKEIHRMKLEEKKIALEQYKEETRREVERTKALATLASCDYQQLALAKEVLQLQIQLMQENDRSEIDAHNSMAMAPVQYVRGFCR